MDSWNESLILGFFIRNQILIHGYLPDFYLPRRLRQCTSESVKKFVLKKNNNERFF
jgi:hypothetical protein